MKLALPLVAILLAGCLSSPSASMEGEPLDATPPTPATHPSGFQRDISVLGGADAAGTVAGECELQPWCFGYPFEVQVPTSLDAILEWSLPASDFDLVLLLDGREHARAADHVPDTRETLRLDLEPGSYELVVIPFLVANDDAVLDARFALAG